MQYVCNSSFVDDLVFSHNDASEAELKMAICLTEFPGSGYGAKLLSV